MAGRIEDYALIGDCQAAALVCRDGSIDWLCLPRFDSAALFASLLGKPENGRWLIAPQGEVKAVRRAYRDGTLVLDTEFETADGVVVVTDCMPIRAHRPELVRIVEGKRGQVPMHTELIVRFDYGSIMPWVRARGDGIGAIAGPDSVVVRSPVHLHGEDFTTVAEFTVGEGERVGFTLTYHPSYEKPPAATDPVQAVVETEAWWRQWSARFKHDGPYHEAVLRSLITLKALTYRPSGGIVAAPTTSLPEWIGGVRNWDYRYCWLRDATFTLFSLLNAGFADEAAAWREWLLRAVAGSPDETQIMYGLGGERRLTEMELDWLPGYENSRPVRVGNAASKQFQLDVYGEVLDAMHQSRCMGLHEGKANWGLERALLSFLEKAWERPDEGIWEVRGPRRHFTHSKVMAWVAFDRAVKAVERFGLKGPVARWRTLRDAIHAQVCRDGFDAAQGSFVQSYGSQELDASLLTIPLVGFLPATDPRMQGTVAAIEKGLMHDGFVARYASQSSIDGLPPGEGAFLPCTFWLADNYVLQGREDEATALFERLLALRNDVGLLAEEYDPKARRLLGNFPQAFTHVGLVNTATNLCRAHGPARQRRSN
jgi:GH15 family glucan-1,4-alpha-glucosidase